MEKAKQDAMSHGGQLHRLHVKDDQGGSNYIGDLLDDGRGPNPRTIPNTLICENAFEKNFVVLEQLDKFNFYCYNKARDFGGFLRFMDYLKQRKKAARVTLDAKGTVGYLFPGSPLADNNPKFICYYKGTAEVGAKRPATQDLVAQSHSQSNAAAPAASAAVYRPPRRSAVSQPVIQDAPDYDPSVNITPLRVPRKMHPPPPVDGCVYVPPKRIPAWPALDFNGHNVGQELPASFAASDSPETTSAVDRTGPPVMRFQPSSPPSSPPRTSSEGSQAPMIYAPRSPEAPPRYYSPKSPEPPVSYTPRSPEGPAPGGIPNSAPPPVKSSWGDDQNEAANFYAGLVRTRQSRTESLLYHMRELNNWVKSVLIRYVSPAMVGSGYIEVLDLACGKGGDFHKWLKLKDRSRIGRYVGSDIAKGSLDEAIERFESNVTLKNGFGAALMLVCADLTSESLTESDLQVWEARTRQWEYRPPLYPSDTFDVVSMQFALHYMFQTEEKVLHFFRTVATHLRTGGSFIATTVDANVILNMLGARAFRDEATGLYAASIHDDKERELCRIDVDSATYEELFSPTVQNQCSLYGLRYRFTLRDNVGQDQAEAVNAPEWMVPKALLVEVAGKFGLELVYAKNFHQFVKDNRDDYDTAVKAKFFNYKGTVNDVEWAIAKLYIAYKFKKIREVPM